jgi:hypothetical protein
VFVSLIAGVHAQPRGRTQKIQGSDIGTDLAGSCRRFKKCPKRWFQSLLEVRWQNLEGRASRVQGRGESALGRDEGVGNGKIRLCLHRQENTSGR